MSKVLDLDNQEVIDYCTNCEAEIHFGQPVWKIGSGLVCSSQCLLSHIDATTMIAGREVTK